MHTKHLISLLLLAIIAEPLTAQYYYKDIISTNQAIEEMANLKDAKIKTVSVKSFEGREEEASKDFFCEKKISKDYKKIETYTKSGLTGKSILTSYFNEKGILTKSSDSSEIAVITNDYTYNSDNKLAAIITRSHSTDDDFTNTLNETRQYYYNEKGLPVKMIRIRNKRDTTEIEFTVAEDGTVSEEYEILPNGRHYYYYYDEKNRLTDVVRYNIVLKKAIPDYLFEYNNTGQLSQMLVTEDKINNAYAANDGTLLWTYMYDGKLRIKEKCYSEDRKLLGYFEYEYK